MTSIFNRTGEASQLALSKQTSVSNTEQAMYPTCFSAYLMQHTPLRLSCTSVMKSICCVVSIAGQHVLIHRYQVSSLFVAKLHVIPQHVYVEQLPYILFLVVLCSSRKHITMTSRLAQTIKHHQCCLVPDKTLPDANFLRILPSSLSTRSCSCSLFEQLRMSDMNTCTHQLKSANHQRHKFDQRTRASYHLQPAHVHELGHLDFLRRASKVLRSDTYSFRCDGTQVCIQLCCNAKLQ